MTRGYEHRHMTLIVAEITLDSVPVELRIVPDPQAANNSVESSDVGFHRLAAANRCLDIVSVAAVANGNVIGRTLSKRQRSDAIDGRQQIESTGKLSDAFRRNCGNPGGFIEISGGVGSTRGCANGLLTAEGRAGRRVDVSYVVVIDRKECRIYQACGFNVTF